MPKQILNILNADDNVDFFMKFVLWFFAILVPLYDVAGALIILIIIDLITGIIASIKKSAPFQWSKIFNTFNKLIIYCLILLAAWVIESKIIPSIPFMRLVAGFLALTELRSILENFKDIFGIDAWDYIRAAIKRQNVQEISKKN
jgi:phage-related holin|tara:strand:- start:6928 stop:7362 length:435 start_codon:yes stop_codon:yes gene_type:complete